MSRSKETPVQISGVSITRDWNRPDPLKVENQDPSKVYRWVDKSKFDQRMYEGWSKTDPDNVKYANPDGAEHDGACKYRELTLCEMPREKAEARNHYYHDKAKRAAEAANSRFHSEARRLGVRTDI